MKTCLRSIGIALAVASCCVVVAADSADDNPAADSSQARIGELIEQLGHDDFFVRQRAEEELAGFSFDAFDMLMAATKHQDLEIAARARHLLRLLTVAWAGKDDPEVVRQILSDYETRSGVEKVLLMEELAALEDGQGVAALCRLIRFEQSLVLSKHAALAVLGHHRVAEPPAESICRKIEKHLSGSFRPGAVWLTAWTAFREDPAAAVERFGALVDEEEALLTRVPSETSTDIVAGLAHVEIRWLKKLDRNEAVLAATRVLIRLEKGDPQQLLELLDWLIEQRAWVLVDELAARFSEVFAGQPVLLYAVADALLAQDKQSAADRAAGQALQVHPGSELTDLHRHKLVAELLTLRGQTRWAIQEYQHVIRNGTPGTEFVFEAQVTLSELLHDQGEDLKGGETLEELLAELDKRPEPDGPPKPAGPNPFGPADDPIELTDEARSTIRARMHFFLACHYESRDDRAKQREQLDKALDTGHADIDVLIACHRLPEKQPEYRQRIAKLIDEESARLRKNAADEPLSPKWYNQYAWLVGNTDGDLDTALKYSKRSIEIAPGYGGYLDTLAHVHFARGEYDKAVEVQTEAAELEPHSGLIARQLRVFTAKLEETTRED